MPSNPPAANRRRLIVALAALFVGALALRLIHLVFMSRSLFFSNPIIDEKFSVDAAWAIAQGQSPHAGLEFWKPPLYEYFLAGLFSVGGKVLWLPRLAQALLDAGSCVLTVLVARQLFPARTAWTAGIAVALNGVLIYFTGELVSASLAIFLDLALLLMLLRAAARPSAWRWLAAGALLGACVLDRAEMLLMIPVAALFAGNAPRPMPSPARRLLAGGLVVVAALVVIAPVTWHNYQPHHRLVPVSTNGGINLYIGTMPQYRGIVGVRPGPEWEALVRSPPLLGHGTDPEVSDYYRGRALEFMAAHPATYAAHVGKKLLVFFHGHELASNYDLYTARGDSPVLAALLFHARGLYFPFGLIGPLALLGVALAWRRPGARLLLGFLAVQLVTVALFFVTARFRAPSLPVLSIFAAHAALWLWDRIRARQWRRRELLAAAAVTAVLYGGANCGAAFSSDREFYRTRLSAEHHHFRGTALFASYDDRYPEAAGELATALRLRPSAPTYFNLGRTLLIVGRIREGVDALVEALMRCELDPGAQYLRPAVRGVLDLVRHQAPPELADRAALLEALECFQGHEWPCALAGFEAARRTAEPGSTTARAADFYLARSLAGKGIDELAEFRYRAATASLERAVQMRPDDSDIHLGLGYVYARLGREDEAREQFLAFRRLERVPGSFFHGAARPDNDIAGALGFSIIEAYTRLLPEDAEARAARAEVRRRQHRLTDQ